MMMRDLFAIYWEGRIRKWINKLEKEAHRKRERILLGDGHCIPRGAVGDSPVDGDLRNLLEDGSETLYCGRHDGVDGTRNTRHS